MSDQFELDFGPDEICRQADIMYKQLQYNGSNNIYIFGKPGKYTIGYRWHDLGGTDYQHIHEISDDVALYLYMKYNDCHTLFGDELREAAKKFKNDVVSKIISDDKYLQTQTVTHLLD